MSFILDALRKSEIERQRQSGPSIAEIPIAREDRRLPVALIAIGVLLAVNVGVLLFFLLRDGRAAEPEAVAPVAATHAPAAASPPAATNPTTNPPSPLPATGGNEFLFGGQEPLPETYSQVVPDATIAPGAPDPTLLPDAPTTAGSGSVNYGEPPQPQQNLPTDPGAGLPPLAIDLHIFTDNTANRAVFINGRRYTQGATIVEGPTVEEITRDGAVLSYRGRRFLLPRQ
jgi:general secretion pathway protein B